MAAAAAEQLTLEVAPRRSKAPDEASFKIAGAVWSPTRQLLQGARLRVIVVDEEGQPILEADASCAEVAFKRHRATTSRAAWLERAHKIELE
jgi:hypothetical protein